MWTEITRPKYERAGRRYASDLTDAEWRVIEPYIPAVKRLGRLREADLRALAEAILYYYIARTGCQWCRSHPADIQDCDGAGIVIQAIHNLFSWLRNLFADSVYSGPNLRMDDRDRHTRRQGYWLSTPSAPMGC